MFVSKSIKVAVFGFAISILAAATQSATAATETKTPSKSSPPVAAAGHSKRSHSPPVAPTNLGRGRWVTRASLHQCPSGTTAYVADDGGVRCWAGPD